MPYLKAKKYRTKADIIQLIWSKTSIIILFSLLAAGLLAFKNRVFLFDYFRTYFY